MLKSKRNRLKKPWITNGIITSIRKNDHLYKLWRKSIKKLKTNEGDPILYQNYKEYCKQLKVIIKCAKRMISSRNSKGQREIVKKYGKF